MASDDPSHHVDAVPQRDTAVVISSRNKWWHLLPPLRGDVVEPALVDRLVFRITAGQQKTSFNTTYAIEPSDRLRQVRHRTPTVCVFLVVVAAVVFTRIVQSTNHHEARLHTIASARHCAATAHFVLVHSVQLERQSLVHVLEAHGCHQFNVILHVSQVDACTIRQVVSLNRLSFGCGTTPRRQSGYIKGFCLGSSRDL